MNGNDSSPIKTVYGINTNSFISLGLLIAVIAGIFTVVNAVYSARYEITRKQDKFEMVMEGFTKRLDKSDTSRETWGFHNMFKWAVHLQRDNPQLKVPEPDAADNTP